MTLRVMREPPSPPWYKLPEAVFFVGCSKLPKRTQGLSSPQPFCPQFLKRTPSKTAFPDTPSVKVSRVCFSLQKPCRCKMCTLTPNAESCSDRSVLPSSSVSSTPSITMLSCPFPLLLELNWATSAAVGMDIPVFGDVNSDRGAPPSCRYSAGLSSVRRRVEAPTGTDPVTTKVSEWFWG